MCTMCNVYLCLKPLQLCVKNIPHFDAKKLRNYNIMKFFVILFRKLSGEYKST